MTLSVCMIVKDEEATIARCLACAATFADEIIVVDTGSTDGTVNAARAFTDKILSFAWCDDFSLARNYSFANATSDYIMWLDADDVITKENTQILAKLKEEEFDVAFVKYVAGFDGDKPSFVYYRERIFRRDMGFEWQGAVHEAIMPRGKIVYSEAAIFHKKVKQNPPARNLRIYQGLIAAGKRLTPRDRFYYGRELFFNGFYEECVAVLKRFLAGDGWVENKIEACSTLFIALEKLGDKAEALTCLLHAFALSYPRPRECCYLASTFEVNEPYSAIYWYKRALDTGEDLRGGGFISLDYCGFIPAIRLCVLYDKMGDYAAANRFNELAGTFKPNDKSYLYNKKYFQNKQI